MHDFKYKTNIFILRYRISANELLSTIYNESHTSLINQVYLYAF